MWDSKTLAGLLEPSMVKVFTYLRRSMRDESRNQGLNFTQMTALRVLELDGPKRMTDLATSLELSGSACSAMVDALEKRGLLERQLDSEDRRATRLAATDEGRRVTERVLHAAYEGLADAMQGLTSSDRFLVLGGFDALARAITQMEAADPER